MPTIETEHGPTPQSPDVELEKELAGRAEHAGSCAARLEEEAREWRNAERAYVAGLTALRQSQEPDR